MQMFGCVKLILMSQINTLYVGNLPAISPPTHPPNFLEESLRALFSRCAGYKRMSFRQKINGPMCFVEFEDVPFASQAIKDLYGHNLVSCHDPSFRASELTRVSGRSRQGWDTPELLEKFARTTRQLSLVRKQLVPIRRHCTYRRPRRHVTHFRVQQSAKQLQLVWSPTAPGSNVSDQRGSTERSDPHAGYAPSERRDITFAYSPTI